MKYVFIVSPTLKDADGVFGLIHAMAQRDIAPEDMDITYIQPLYGDDNKSQDSFHDLYLRFRNAVPEGCRYQVRHSTVPVSNTPNATENWAFGVASTIETRCDSVCIFLDLGTACENKETTALYRVLRNAGMSSRCILYAPYPDAKCCTQWKEDNECDDFVVRRENVTRARAIYVPMRNRFCEALGISDN